MQWLLPSLPCSISWGIQSRINGETFHWNHILSYTPAAYEWLQQQGLQPKQRLGIAAHNSPTVAALLQAAPLLGLQLVLLHHRLPRTQLKKRIEEAALDLLICDEEGINGISVPELQESDDADNLPDCASPHDAALILYTSGSSSRAKTVHLSWSAVLHACQSACLALELTTHNEWLCCLPLDHIGGASIVLRAACAGYAIRLHQQFDAAAIRTNLTDTSSGCSLVPTMLARVLAYSSQKFSPTLRCLLIGGAASSEADTTRAKKLGCAPMLTWGLSEYASMAYLFNTNSMTGRCVPGAVLSLNQHGTILLDGPALFSGYEQEGTLTETTTVPFDTGDCGHIDPHGELRITGRADLRFCSGGENVSPEEVEMLLTQHPTINRVAVCGLPDSEWGHCCAAICDCARPHNWDEWVQNQLAPYQRPKMVLFEQDIPLLPSGKIDRQALTSLFLPS